VPCLGAAVTPLSFSDGREPNGKMKTFIFTASVLLSVCLTDVSADDFTKGDVLVGIKEVAAKFYDKPARKIKIGELFSFLKYNGDNSRVYVLTSDENGNPIALNVDADAVELKLKYDQEEEAKKELEETKAAESAQKQKEASFKEKWKSGIVPFYMVQMVIAGKTIDEVKDLLGPPDIARSDWTYFDKILDPDTEKPTELYVEFVSTLQGPKVAKISTPNTQNFSQSMEFSYDENGKYITPSELLKQATGN